MVTPPSVTYAEAKARVVRAIAKITSFVAAAGEYKADRSNAGKHAKVAKMLSELNDIRRIAEDDFQVMESSVSKKLAPMEVVDNKESLSLSADFDNLYYELAAFADVYHISLSPGMDTSSAQLSVNQTTGSSNLSHYQLPKRSFPTFSGVLIEWQGFEDLFKSILSHAPDLPDVERFEILKTSLQGEALSLVSHLPLTSANYNKAWEVLRARYGNKRDLARIHLDALLAPHTVNCNDAASIKTLLTTILEHTAALDNLDFVTRQWSPILVHIFENHLDYDLRSRWELTVGDRHQPATSDFVEFLRSHVRSAEARAGNYSTTLQSSTSQPKQSKKVYTTHSRPTYGPKVLTASAALSTESGHRSPAISNCQICKKPHSIRQCQLFLSKGPNDRFQLAKTHRLCINCLGCGHSSAACPSKFKCQSCDRSHHTLLHFESSPATSTPPSSSMVVQSGDPTRTVSLVVKDNPQKVVLLSTVLLDICGTDGHRHSFRALLDSGSQASFIRGKSADILMLNRRRSPVSITTFANTTATPVCGSSVVIVTPHGKQTPSLSIDALIVPQITGKTPQISFTPGQWTHIHHLPLADPSYHIPGDIDLLLGADILPSILCDSLISGSAGEPTALKTIFGWVLFGPTTTAPPVSLATMCVSTSSNLDATLRKFWELEELPVVHHLSPDDKVAEEIYVSTTTRLSSGRFMVTLPFRTPSPVLGDSKTHAHQRYKALELRLSRQPDLRKQYIDFMQDYLSSGHMELVPVSERDNPLNYYIPHHCVIKPDSKTTKLRVVFNASARTSTGASLNESMYTGPKLQPDIQVVLLRSRLWKYLFMADIKQMYRQILVQPSDRDYLRILWRFSPSSPIDEYRLCTVTYGTSAAPFQALRTIRHLATLDGARWPVAADVLLNDTFVDDILTGANSEADALYCQDQLINLCALAQFELRKWASNNVQLLQMVPPESRAMSVSVLFDSDELSDLKVLGLKWDPSADTFSFKAQPSMTQPTKRSVLSDIARVFDPLGLLSPMTFFTKHVMQQLWTSGINWDDPVPSDIASLWARYQSELQLIETISIPRRITYDHAISVQLHAFSDSSEKGYAAAVYLRVETVTSVYCHLITGKSKVAPLKRSTIPRLELCGAVLASKLLRLVADSYTNRITIDELHAWTDSTTALVWIRSSPHRWATFIANRTSLIHDLTTPAIWRHVPTKENPVDCASRGLFPSELLNHSLWWTGPSFLLSPPDKWPKLLLTKLEDFTGPPSREARVPTVLTVTVDIPIINLLNRMSSLQKILRVIAYCFRFSKPRSDAPISNIINATEITRALSALVYLVQRQTFAVEIAALSNGLPCSKSLRRLDLFIDPVGVLRVGGRLRNAEIPYVHKHPALLPSRHRLTDLIIDHNHCALSHPGAMTLQSHLQREFWILSGRQAIRSRLRLCLPCFRTRPQTVQPKMAALPKYRVQQIKPFAISGVDYAGPISIKGSRGRASSRSSAYICLFVCTVTKALHIELSSDLSTETFLLAFTRFAARRGPIKEIHSDCGTNFVGAANILNPLHNFIASETYQHSVRNHLSKDQITWFFNPPSSPHFGGLWEAGVKSTKSLIFRSIGTHRLTSEELITLLTKIEATLNSRPLCALSNDPKDLEALTPSHFLTLVPSTSLPDPCLENVPLSKMQRWRLVTDLHRYFWTRWKNEYLSTLQLRTKWSDDGKQLNVGDLVLIKEPSHPLYWRYGRITDLHPGADGVSRVATVHTSSGVLTRPAVKLCPVPSC
ncbi:uncharacterized protein LOC132949125 [Metopolophium dirhodum]|uniref:uncharacterized protein LOC132949125 n=2 Tax=Metopolophium dirhodum TaxID=44670 RepID=UPI0029906C82|nr:uncharacterized protein LOC132949125 [Metopolophium dirhodum]